MVDSSDQTVETETTAVVEELEEEKTEVIAKVAKSATIGGF